MKVNPLLCFALHKLPFLKLPTFSGLGYYVTEFMAQNHLVAVKFRRAKLCEEAHAMLLMGSR